MWKTITAFFLLCIAASSVLCVGPEIPILENGTVDHVPLPFHALKRYKHKKQDVLNAIRSKNRSWVPEISPEFENFTSENQFQVLLGAVDEPVVSRRRTKNPSERRRLPPPHPHGNHGHGQGQGQGHGNQDNHPRIARQSSLPDTFDLRTKYPGCTSLGSIRYQYRCSSCWAMTAASVMSDRHCIYNFNTTGQIYVSPMHVISCVPRGCSGGKEWDAFDYWVRNGIVSGGTFYGPANQPYGCLPYAYNINATPTACPTACSVGHTKSFANDKTYGSDWYNWWSPNVQKIQQEIYNYGPVVAFFNSYEDLFYYKTGVYEYAYGNLVGYHLIKLIGWGRENGKDYWLAVNTWGVNWGQSGILKIRRGVNEVGIEGRISSALPRGALQ